MPAAACDARASLRASVRQPAREGCNSRRLYEIELEPPERLINSARAKRLNRSSSGEGNGNRHEAEEARQAERVRDCPGDSTTVEGPRAAGDRERTVRQDSAGVQVRGI